LRNAKGTKVSNNIPDQDIAYNDNDLNHNAPQQQQQQQQQQQPTTTNVQ
jgi:hypothetical protein